MAKLIGLNSVASFAVPAGAMSDHLPFLQHVLRDKAAHGERIRNVLLLLDPDFFGTRPWTNLQPRQLHAARDQRRIEVAVLAALPARRSVQGLARKPGCFRLDRESRRWRNAAHQDRMRVAAVRRDDGERPT